MSSEFLLRTILVVAAIGGVFVLVAAVMHRRHRKHLAHIAARCSMSLTTGPCPATLLEKAGQYRSQKCKVVLSDVIVELGERRGSFLARRRVGRRSHQLLYFELGSSSRLDGFCVLPETETHILGRSYAWPIQRAWIVDTLDPRNFNIIADWRTLRPMSTRLGPDEGITHSDGAVYLVTATGHSDYWIGNRTIVDRAGAGNGFQVLSSAIEDSRDFHDCNVSFAWSG